MWYDDVEYRIKPVVLQWTDLKIGDVIRRGWHTRMVTGIDAFNTTDHIHTGDMWIDDEELESWEKV